MTTTSSVLPPTHRQSKPLVSVPAIVVYCTFDEATTEFPYPVSSSKVEDFENWLKELAIPILGEVNGDTYEIYVTSGWPLAYLFVDPNEKKSQDYIDALKPVASKHCGKVNFVWIDATKFGDHTKALNPIEEKWPSFVVYNSESQLKYPYDQSKDVEAAAVSAMVANYLDSKLMPELKSQPVPETQDESVFTLVCKQFDEVIFDDSKDVFMCLGMSDISSWWRTRPIVLFLGVVTASPWNQPGIPLVIALLMQSCAFLVFEIAFYLMYFV